MEGIVPQAEEKIHFSTCDADGHLKLLLNLVFGFLIQCERSNFSRRFIYFDLFESVFDSDEQRVLPGGDDFLTWD